MKFSVDIKEFSVVVYLSVVFRRNLVTNGCTSQSADYPPHPQGGGSQMHQLVLPSTDAAI